MSWNYRILAHEDLDTYFQIHEVYYNEEGKPDAHAKCGAIIGTDILSEMKDEIDLISSCLSKPVLWAGNRFPEEYKETVKGSKQRIELPKVLKQ